MKAEFIPRIFGYLLYLAGASYIFIHGIGRLEIVSQDLISMANNILAAPMALAEIRMAI